MPALRKSKLASTTFNEWAYTLKGRGTQIKESLYVVKCDEIKKEYVVRSGLIVFSKTCRFKGQKALICTSFKIKFGVMLSYTHRKVF